MSEVKRYTITAALPYANGPVHIGHLAGVYVPADIYARYLRLNERDVAFVCGSDEHGVPITLRAKKEQVTPQHIVDKYHRMIKKSFKDFGMTFDIYSRTTSETHHQTAAAMFKQMYNDGKFTAQTSEQYYDEKNNQFLADRYIVGTCPNCKFDGAYGDQCENCGTALSPRELINPKSTISGENPILKETKHWYLPLDQYEDWLKEWLLEGHQEWKPNVYGQCKSWITQGLKPRAMTRDLNWGIKVPIADAAGKVLYVWFDAPIGYISFTKEWAEMTGKNWEDYWKREDTKLVHFIGKDNIVFHCIIFPTILKASDLILPDNVPANEFMNLEGNKISTSRNWAVWLHEYLEDFPGKEDVLRYTLCANAPESKDNDFTWKDFQARNNNELVAIYGNFINRALVLTHKYFEGKVPERGELTAFDEETIIKLKGLPEKIAASLEQYKFREALNNMMELARLGNKYLADTEPWKLIKEDEQRVKTILNISLQIAANLAIVSEPFLPFTSKKLQVMLGIADLKWADSGNIDLLESGHQIDKPSLLFEKIEDEMIEKQIQKLEDTKKENELAAKTIPEQKSEVGFDDFMKMDIRIGTILEAEKVKKSKKLLKLKVDTGIDQRIVVSGIAQYYDPDAILGKQVCMLVNLAPRKIMGIESQGMILMAENIDGTLSFLKPEKAIENGGGVS